MWEILLSNADWDCFRTLTLREILKIQNPQPVNGKNKSHNKIDVVHDIDSVPSNVQSASREVLLYV